MNIGTSETGERTEVVPDGENDMKPCDWEGSGTSWTPNAVRVIDEDSGWRYANAVLSAEYGRTESIPTGATVVVEREPAAGWEPDPTTDEGGRKNDVGRGG